MIGAKIAVPNLLPWLGGIDQAFSVFEDRVREDGGTDVSQEHTRVVINDFRTAALFDPNDLLLLNGCSAGKADVLYSIIAFSDYNTWLTRVTAGVVADTDFVIDTVQEFQRAGLYDDASLLTICAAGDADDLYTFKPI